MNLLTERALFELHELRADLAVLVRVRQVLEERVESQRTIKRDCPFHLSDEGCSVMGAVRLSIKSIDDKISEYKEALNRLERGNEHSQSPRISLVWDSNEDGDGGGGDPELSGA